VDKKPEILVAGILDTKGKEIKFLEAENQEKLKAHLSRLREEITNLSCYKNICKFLLV